ncbi:MAG TPA: hypothetical protein VF121_09240 [Thermoanaerobaculia bacterium]|nr:hypothetical protein [Thermoanaerobaculia bacterium]
MQRPRLLVLLAAALLAVAGYAACEWYLLDGDVGFPLDDSWIHLQFARNLAAGDGLSYNPGEPVTGSTAPLWTALLSLVFLLPGGTAAAIWGAKLLGGALYLAGVHAAWRLARELGLSPGLAQLAAALALGTSWLVWSAVSGMEVPLFVLLSLWGMVLHLRERRRPERPPLALGLFGLAALARPEGLLLLALAALDRLLVFDRDGEGALVWRRPDLRGLAVGLALAALALAPVLAFYAAAGGSLLPTTFAAKGAEVRRWLPEARYVYQVLGILFRPQPWTVLFAGAGIAALVERLGTPRDRGLLPALWLLALPLAYSTLSPAGTHWIAGNFGRYYFPLFPVVAVLGVLGLERAAAALGPRITAGRLRLPLRAALAALLLWPTAATLVEGALFYSRNVANVQASDVRVARWLAPRLPPEAVLAVNDIGAIKFLLPNRVIDLAGIATPEVRRRMNAAAARREPWERAVLEFLAERRPDYLVIFPSWFPNLSRDPRFRPVAGLRIPDNVTMGGDEVVVYATPWTRHPLREPS